MAPFPDDDAQRVYLDSASIEPLRPAAREAYLAALDQGWADPLRLHTEARRARAIYDSSREAVADVLGCRADEVTFVSSGTDAVHRGLSGLVRGRARNGTRLVHSAVEHSSVHQVADAHEAAGGVRTSVPVSHYGVVDPDAAAESVAADDAAAIAVQSANLESGAVQPAEAIADLCERTGVPWFCDLTGTAGRLEPVAGWAVAAAGAQAWGGPAGVGVLCVRKRTRWRTADPPDDRLDPRSPGLENVPAIVAAATALADLDADRRDRATEQRRLTGLIRAEAARRIPDVELVGPDDARLPHIASMSFLYVDGEVLVGELDRLGFAVASGSACTASSLEPSHVLAAMGVLTHGNVRASLGCATTERDVRRFVDALESVVAAVRRRIGDP